jgi:hypothetical protein
LLSPLLVIFDESRRSVTSPLYLRLQTYCGVAANRR